jgi:UDP-N-acetylmuramate: L-alanyl-gamma-D-glutamyl-meso-diaminopimelate ligase
MHNLALALEHKGYKITVVMMLYLSLQSRLQAKGLLPVEFGWFPEKINTDLDAIVLGMHAKGR